MAKKTTELTAAATLDGDDLLPLSQQPVTPGTWESRKVTLDELATFFGLTPGGGSKYVNVQLSDMDTAIVTGTNKAVWFPGESGTLVSVFIGVNTPSSSGIVRVDMNDDAGTTVFTARPSIDVAEDTSLTGTGAVLDSPVTFVAGDKFTFDIDDAGTGAKGLQVVIEYAP